LSDLVRLSFSIDRSLADKLDRLCGGSGYENRSEFIRDLIRARLVEEEWRSDHEAVGAITLVFDHHAHGLNERLTDLQHDHHEVILASTHVHLDHDLCAEVVLCRGPATRLKAIADGLRQHRGVLHAALSMSSTGRELR
jgi:CopG family nickel-responsive transcriptional regulator